MNFAKRVKDLVPGDMFQLWDNDISVRARLCTVLSLGGLKPGPGEGESQQVYVLMGDTVVSRHWWTHSRVKLVIASDKTGDT